MSNLQKYYEAMITLKKACHEYECERNCCPFYLTEQQEKNGGTHCGIKFIVDESVMPPPTDNSFHFFE